ncbi:uncharacterized protein AB675_5668 [Cyphellophora attinorum]|uniref:Uncharacterized protein n=1 Tax=Cyphellophora attinorum TaxID=1664694 RepID=A0A0N0NNW9_9EURO|nr:uncharacterized protein AB675_5668 [Phialophora attinorum]KPI42038.1 hypothetical protein AB675_5668 [Phialophora attinorum]
MVVAIVVVGGLAIAHKVQQKRTAKKEARKAAIEQQGHAMAAELPTSMSQVDLSTPRRPSIERTNATRGLPAYETLYAGTKPVMVDFRIRRFGSMFRGSCRSTLLQGVLWVEELSISVVGSDKLDWATVPARWPIRIS